MEDECHMNLVMIRMQVFLFTMYEIIHSKKYFD